jgi:hypothetical protein
MMQLLPLEVGLLDTRSDCSERTCLPLSNSDLSGQRGAGLCYGRPITYTTALANVRFALQRTGTLTAWSGSV